MISDGTTVILRTEDAIYSPCKIVRINKKSLLISYCPGTTMDKNTGTLKPDRKTISIATKDVLYIKERL